MHFYNPKKPKEASMKRFILCTMAVLCYFLISVSLAKADTVISIHAEWTAYTAPSELTTAGFRLYQQGVYVAQWNGPATVSGDAVITVASNSTETQDFTLTAVFTNGTESPHSSAFPFDVSDYLDIVKPSGVMRLSKAYPPLRSNGEKVFVPYTEGTKLVKLNIGGRKS